MRSRLFPTLVLASTTAALVACGGSESGSNSATLSGTAATGAPIKGGTVTVQCQSASAASTPTGTDGTWTMPLPSGAQMPCALQVSGGDLPSGDKYHSLALATGTINITPWTDLVVANLVGSNPATWWASTQLASNLKAITQTALDTALTTVNTQLGVTTTMVDGGNPFTSTFKANGSDKLDKVLDAFKKAASTSGSNYAALLAEAAKGSKFTAPAAFSSVLSTQLAALSSPGSGNGSGSGSCPAPGVNLTYTAHNGATGGPVASGATLCFTTVSTTTLAFGTTTLTSPQNTGGTAPYSFWTFTDPGTSLRYEVIFNGSALHEINLTGPASSGSQFMGQFAAASGGSGSSSGGTATGVTIPGGETVAASVVATYLPLINGAGNKIIKYDDTSSGASVDIYDYVSYITVAVGKPGFSAKLVCALNSSASTFYPMCSVAGVQFDRSAGTVSFMDVTVSPIVQISYKCTTTPCRINGSLAFTGYQ